MNRLIPSKTHICTLGILLLSALVSSTANGQSLAAQGEAAFYRSCTQCHDADRSFQKRKSQAGWLATVRRMASLDDADIPTSTHIAIAAFLTSRSSPNQQSPRPQSAPVPSPPPDVAPNPPQPAFPTAPRAQPPPTGPTSPGSTSPTGPTSPGQASTNGPTTSPREPQPTNNNPPSLNSADGDDGNLGADQANDVGADQANEAGADQANDSGADSPTDTNTNEDPASSSDSNRDQDRADANSEQDNQSNEADEDSIWDELSNEVGSGLSTSGTISPLWRGGNDNLENPNFFIDAWLRADWQPSGPLRARVTACTSCHSDATGGSGFTLELAEAYAAFDLAEFFDKRSKRGQHCERKLDAELRAGRFIVPFGAFASLSHPGSYGAVTAPLLFNMGRQVNPDNARVPVLPQPFSDEGFNLNLKRRFKNLNATLDVYGINGLQGSGPGIQFTPSRDYTDNNSNVTVGTRATIGNKKFRVGGSVMSGQLQDEGAPELNFNLTGADFTGRFFDDQLRFYFEYAIRRNDSIFGQRQLAYGTVSELNALLFTKPNIRMLARYDTIEHQDFFGNQKIRRFTWGFSTASFGGSTLIINHEHWRFSDSEPDTDILGIRWVTVF